MIPFCYYFKFHVEFNGSHAVAASAGTICSTIPYIGTFST
jgi:hypothetical protein